MLDRNAAQSPGRAAPASLGRGGRARRRALVACAVLALALHAAFIGGIGDAIPGMAPETTAMPMSVRTVPDEAAADAPANLPAVAMPIAAAAAPRPGPPPRPRETAGRHDHSSEASREASADSIEFSPAFGDGVRGVADLSASAPANAPGGAESASSALPEAAASAVEASSAPAAAPPATFLAAGEEPPPVYRTQLPPSATLHYQVRRGFLRGTGEIRWQASGDRYRLVLEARIAGVTLLTQTSEGGVDANGLAPVRFLDQRARRSAQAANFRRDAARITFSATGVEWPLLAGSQDRLSWMIQLAAIAAAEPERLVEGGRITMAVVGARGDAGVWTLRYAGVETIETGQGMVHAVKLVREGRSAYDTSAEIWLDPEHSYLPAHATLRNSAGASEYDLLLERIEPG